MQESNDTLDWMDMDEFQQYGDAFNWLMQNQSMSLADILKDGYQDSDHMFDNSTELLLILSFSVIVVCGVLGNGLVCFVVCRNSNLKSSRNWFILNLAISDIFTCILCLPFTVVRLLLRNWGLGEFMCKLIPCLQTIYVLLSTLTIVAIAADRYKAIVYYNFRAPSKSALRYIFPMIWMVSVAIALPMFVYHKVEKVEFTPGVVLYTICYEKWDSYIARGCYTVAVLIVHYAFPMIVIVTLHILICKFLRMRIQTHPGSQREVQRVRKQLVRHRKNMMLLTAIAVSFAITWLPLTMVNILADMDYHVFLDVDFNLLMAICILLAMSSVCINPIVYGWFNSNFRKEIRNLFKTDEQKDTVALMTPTTRDNIKFRERLSSMYWHSTLLTQTNTNIP